MLALQIFHPETGRRFRDMFLRFSACALFKTRIFPFFAANWHGVAVGSVDGEAISPESFGA